MPQLPWWTVVARYPQPHLMVVIVEDTEAGGKMLARFFNAINLKGDWAMRPMSEPNAQYLQCAFAEESAARKVAKTFKIEPSAPGAGWASQYTFRISPEIVSQLTSVLDADDAPRPRFAPHATDAQVAKEWIRPLCRWWMDLTRNVLVMGGLYWLAEKSDSVPLKVFAYIGIGALYFYVQSYFNTCSFSLFPNIRNRHLNFVVNGIPWVLFTTGLYVVVTRFGQAVFNDLKVLQH